MKTLFLILALNLYLQDALASQEGVLPFSEFRIVSAGIGESGSIAVSGKRNEGVFSSIIVEAFGKVIKIPESVLLQIPANSHNGVQLSYEAGYKVTGGKTIYLKFVVGFINSVREALVLAISENGNVRILVK